MDYTTKDVFPEHLRSDDKPYIDVSRLIRERNEKKEKVRKLYKKILSKCHKDILQANSKDMVDIIFDVPQFIYTEPDYKCSECIEFIQKKLRKSMMDTLILSSKSIFVTWHNIEINKKIYDSSN